MISESSATTPKQAPARSSPRISSPSWASSPPTISIPACSAPRARPVPICFADLGVGAVDGEVVHHRQRLGADADDVVHVHRHAVDPDRVPAPELLGDQQLGAHAVGGDGDPRAVVQPDDVRVVAAGEHLTALSASRAQGGRPAPPRRRRRPSGSPRRGRRRRSSVLAGSRARWHRRHPLARGRRPRRPRPPRGPLAGSVARFRRRWSPPSGPAGGDGAARAAPAPAPPGRHGRPRTARGRRCRARPGGSAPARPGSRRTRSPCRRRRRGAGQRGRPRLRSRWPFRAAAATITGRATVRESMLACSRVKPAPARDRQRGPVARDPGHQRGGLGQSQRQAVCAPRPGRARGSAAGGRRAPSRRRPRSGPSAVGSGPPRRRSICRSSRQPDRGRRQEGEGQHLGLAAVEGVAAPRRSRAAGPTSSASAAPTCSATSKLLRSSGSSRSQSQSASQGTRIRWAELETGSSSVGPWTAPRATARADGMIGDAGSPSSGTSPRWRARPRGRARLGARSEPASPSPRSALPRRHLTKA